MDEQGLTVPERVRVGVLRLPDRRTANVGKNGRPFRLEYFFAVLGTVGRGLDLPKTGRGVVAHPAHAPAVGIGEAACILAALLNEGVLSIEQFTGRTRGVRGLQSIQSTHERA
jgi:hypothetical protein